MGLTLSGSYWLLESSSFTVLEAGSAPARQDLSPGGIPSSLTFGTASGGRLPYSYGATLEKPAGSSAILSGSDVGPYSVLSSSNGEAYKVTLRVTDADAQEDESSTIINILPTGTPTWNVLGTVDLTGLDSASYTSTGIYTADKGGVPYRTFQISRTGAVGFTCTVDSDGILLDGPTSTQGTAQIGIIDTEIVSRTSSSLLTESDWDAPIALQMLLDGVNTSGLAGNGSIAGVCSNQNLPATSGVMQGIRMYSDGTYIDHYARVYRGGTSEIIWLPDYVDNTTGPWSLLLTIIIHYGNIAELRFEWGATSYSTPGTETDGPGQAGGSVSSGDGYLFAYSTIGACIMVQKNSSGTASLRLKGYRFLRYE